MSAPQFATGHSASERFKATRAKLEAKATPPKASDLYGRGCLAGERAALEVLAAGTKPGGTWQHPAIKRIAPENDELRGWLVGYLYALESVTTTNGAWA